MRSGHNMTYVGDVALEILLQAHVEATGPDTFDTPALAWPHLTGPLTLHGLNKTSGFHMLNEPMNLNRAAAHLDSWKCEPQPPR